MKSKYIWGLAASCALFASCENKFSDLNDASSGEANFSKYIAIGNSLTAGYADNSLTREGQEASYPNMLAKQFEIVGGGAFTQPLLPGNYGWPSAKLTLGYTTDCKNVTSLGPVPFRGAADTAGSGRNIGNVNYGNMGTPGIKVAHLLAAGYGMMNPYAGRFYANPATQTPLEVFLEQAPTFFSVWLGNNDVLGYAVSGGEGTVGGLGTANITPTPLFSLAYDSLVNNLVKNGAKGVLINIPDVTSIPFFNTVPTNGAVVNAEQAAQLNGAYAAMGLTHIEFKAGANHFVIEDATMGARHIKSGEYLVLNIPSDSLKCAGWGTLKPIPKKYVLDASEVENVKSATMAFNNIIKDAAARHNLAYVDANAYLKSISSGIKWDGVTYTPTFATGGVFSLDGVHLTQRGYALMANEILRNINAYFHATIPMHNVNQYPGVKLP